jgi:hypothetical protein
MKSRELKNSLESLGMKNKFGEVIRSKSNSKCQAKLLERFKHGKHFSPLKVDSPRLRNIKYLPTMHLKSERLSMKEAKINQLQADYFNQEGSPSTAFKASHKMKTETSSNASISSFFHYLPQF